MADERVLLLSPERDQLSSLVPGSVVIDADCGHRAWISPEGLMFQLGGGVTTRCQDCVDPADVAEIDEVPGSRESLAGMLGKDAAEQLMAEVKRDPAAAVRQLQAQSWRDRKGRRR